LQPLIYPTFSVFSFVQYRREEECYNYVFACGRRRRPGTTAFAEVWSRLDRLDSATVIA
jgi:hypothetical protein